MKHRSLRILGIVVLALLLLPLTGCFCGQFFRQSTDVIGLQISPANSSIRPADSQRFTATGTFAGDGGTGDVTARTSWSSSDPNIATINNAGLATGVKLGTVTISGDCECYVAQTSLSVASNAITLTSIALTPAGPTVGVGVTQQLTATATYSDGTTANITNTAVWSSSNNAIVTVTSGGLATGVATGNAVISATSNSITGQTIVSVQ